MPLQSVPFDEVKYCLDSLTDEIDTVNLIGMNVAQYGQDLGNQYNLMDIVKLLEQKDNITHVSLQGMAFKDAIKNNFAESLKSRKIKVIGGSLETGSPRILSMMNKGYTIPELLTFWQEINEPFAKELNTDIIAGFPTETSEDIQLTMQLLDTIRPQEIMIRKYQNSPYIPSGKYPQLSDEEINDHFNTYIKELKLRGCPTINYDETKI